MHRLTKIQLEKAIVEHLGNKGVIQASLGIKSHLTLNNYIRLWGLQDLVDQQVHAVNDIAKFNICKAINEGDIALSKWWLEKRNSKEFGNLGFLELNDKRKLIIVEPKSDYDTIDE